MAIQRPVGGIFTLYNHPIAESDWETVQVPYLVELYKAILETMGRLGATATRAAYSNHGILKTAQSGAHLAYFKQMAQDGLYAFTGLLSRSTDPIMGGFYEENGQWFENSPWLTNPYYPENGCPWTPGGPNTMPGLVAVEQELSWKFGGNYVSDWYAGNDNPALFCPMCAMAREMAVWQAFHSSWAYLFEHDPDFAVGNKYVLRDLTPAKYYLMTEPRTTPWGETEDPSIYLPCSNSHSQTGGHDLPHAGQSQIEGWLEGVRLIIEAFRAILHLHDVAWYGNWNDEAGYDRWKTYYYDADGPIKQNALALLLDGIWSEAGTDGDWSAHGNTSGGTLYTFGTGKPVWVSGTLHNFKAKLKSDLGFTDAQIAEQVSTGTAIDTWGNNGGTTYDLTDLRLVIGRALDIGIQYHTPHAMDYGHPCPITGRYLPEADVWPQDHLFAFVHPYHVLLSMITWMEYHSGILGDENIGGGVRKYYEEKEGIRNTGRYESFSPVTGESWSGFNEDGIYVRHPDGDKSFVAPATTEFTMPIPAGKDFVSVTACKRSTLFQGTPEEVEAHLFEPDYDAISDWEPNEADSVLNYTGPLPVGEYQRGYIVEWAQEQENDPPNPPVIGMDRD